MQAQAISQGPGSKADGDSPISQALGGKQSGELFTKLLVAQIRNQNPLEPTDPSEFVAQLTQLSQAESMQKLVSQSSSQAALLKGLHALGMGQQVGSRVMVRAEAVTLDSKPFEAAVTLAGDARLTAVLKGPDGREHRVPLGARAGGEAAFEIDPRKLGLPPGRYGLTVQDDKGTAYPVDVAGEVEAVRLSATGGVSLRVGALGEVGAESVTRFLGRKG